MVIGIAGKIGSGKSTLSKYAAAKLGWKYSGFGNVVRHYASLKNIEPTRLNLQNLGQHMVETDIIGFCRHVLQMATWQKTQGLIVDGIRHTDVASSLKNLVSPDDFKLVFLEIADKLRSNRLNTTSHEIAEVDTHISEQQVLNYEVKEMADLVVDAELPIPQQFDMLVGKFGLSIS